MARLLKVKDLDSQKEQLAIKCEIYRQMLQLELHNLRVSTERARGALGLFRAAGPVAAVAVSLAGSLLTRRRQGRLGVLTWVGLKLAQRFAPALKGWIAGRLPARRE